MSARRKKATLAGRRVFSFGDGKADGDAKMKEILGGKGANLAEMTRIGLPVPAGFTISTAVCAEYQAAGDRIPKSLVPEVAKALGKVERVMQARFGHADRPLLLSVRSGARVSMPGMMDTVLNLGLNDRTESSSGRSEWPKRACMTRSTLPSALATSGTSDFGMRSPAA